MNIHRTPVFNRKLLSVVVANLLLASAAHADTVQQSKIQVTAQTEAGLETLVTLEELEKLQANDLEDIFRKDPSVSVGGSTGIAQKIYVRGVEDTLLNVTVDGATQAGYLFHHQGRLSIEPELLKQVEVQAGAGSALDGPGALGGAIRFVTKDPTDLLRGGEDFGGLVKLGYYSNTQGTKLSSSLFGRVTDNISAMATIAGTNSDNIVDGNGDELANTDTSQDLGFFKAVAELSEDQQLRVSYDQRDDDGVRLTRAHWVPSSRNAPIDQKSHRDTTTLNYTFNPANSELLNLDITVYDTDSFIEQDGAYGIYEGRVKSQGFDLRNSSKFGNHELTYGVDYRRDEGLLTNKSDSTVPVSSENSKVAGLYIQDNLQVTDQLLLSFGARYDAYTMVDVDEQDFSENALSPNVSFVYQLTPKLALTGGYAEAMRGKQTQETFVLDWVSNSINLQPEEADNFELGFNYQDGGFSLAGQAYVGHIDNVIDSEGRDVVNVGDVQTKGFNARVGYEWSKWQAGLSFAYTRPELNGNPLSDDNWSIGTSNGDTWIADVVYQPNNRLELGWNGRFVQRLTDVATGYSEKPGFAVHDIYAQWLPTNTDDIKLTLTVNNLFDRYYHDHATYGNYGEIAQGLPEAGRDVRLSFAWRF